jgi:hypothetical protein
MAQSYVGVYLCVFARQLETEAAKKSFEEGQKVEARFRGRAKWFKGKVRRVNRDGTYDIEYEDGDNERDVAAELVRALEESKPAPPDACYEKGQKVEALFRGRSKWFKGMILRANRDGTYDVEYEDGDKETGVEAKLIRALEGVS